MVRTTTVLTSAISPTPSTSSATVPAVSLPTSSVLPSQPSNIHDDIHDELSPAPSPSSSLSFSPWQNNSDENHNNKESSDVLILILLLGIAVVILFLVCCIIPINMTRGTRRSNGNRGVRRPSLERAVQENPPNANNISSNGSSRTTQAPSAHGNRHQENAGANASQQHGQLVLDGITQERVDHVAMSLTSVTIGLEGQEEPIGVLSSWKERQQDGEHINCPSVVHNKLEHPAESVKMCVICCDQFENGDKVSFSNNPKCEHCFHTECISSWLAKHQDCPICRQAFL